MKYTREQLVEPIVNEFRAILTRREKSKGGTPRYYLYTQDNNNDLIIASENYPSNQVFFRISASSKEFYKKSKFYLGKIEHNNNRPDFEIFQNVPIEKNHIGTVTHLRRYERDGKERKFDVILNTENGPQKFEMQDFSTFQHDFPGIETTTSKNTIYLKKDNKLAFVLYQIEEDEFQFIARKPFNIFSSFAVALTSLVYVKSELC